MAHRRGRRAYSYLRFSSPEQAKGDSFRRQTALAVEYARVHKLDLDESLSFHDLGVSAWRGVNSETGQLSTLLDAVQCGLIPKKSVILVESLDRISRQAARKALRVIESIVESGVSVVTLNDGREYTAESLDNDPINLLIALLTFIRANEESVIKSQRLAAVWAAKRVSAATKPMTSRCPGWITLRSQERDFVIVPEHAEIVPNYYPAAVTSEKFMRVQRLRNLPGRRVSGPGVNPEIRNIFAYLGRCAHCESAMIISSRSGKNRYLVCRKVHLKAGCHFQTVRYNDIEDTIVKRFNAIANKSLPAGALVVQSHMDRIRALLASPVLDRTATNTALRMVLDSVSIHPEDGRLSFNWKHGGTGVIESAFTPTRAR